MPGGRFSKQAIYSSAKLWNTANVNDTQIGGLMTGVPSSISASQGFQTLPGDRIIMSPSDALVYSNNSVENMFSGTFRYVAMRNNSTANAIRGRAAFWDNAVAGVGGNNDGLYQVTADGNQANVTNLLFAGVYINNITYTNGTSSYWWVRETGKHNLHFVNAVTGTGAIGSPVMLPQTAAANNNATDNGSFDTLDGANSGTIFQANSTTAYTTVGNMIKTFVGIALVAPSNNNYSLTQLPNFRIWTW